MLAGVESTHDTITIVNGSRQKHLFLKKFTTAHIFTFASKPQTSLWCWSGLSYWYKIISKQRTGECVLWKFNTYFGIFSLSHNRPLIKIKNNVGKKVHPRATPCLIGIHVSSEDLPSKNTAPIINIQGPYYSLYLIFNTHFPHFTPQTIPLYHVLTFLNIKKDILVDLPSYMWIWIIPLKGSCDCLMLFVGKRNFNSYLLHWICTIFIPQQS